MYGKSIYEKRILTTIVTVIFIVSIVGTVYAFEQLGASNANTLTGDIGIGGTVQQAYGWNGSVFEQGTITGAGLITTNTVTIAFSDFAPKVVVIFEGNNTYNVKGLGNSSYFYNTLNVKTSGTGVLGGKNVSLTGAYFVIGTQVNDTSLTSIKDKSVKDITLNNTVYSNTTNKLNQSYDIGLVQLMASSLTDRASIILTTNASQKAGSTSTVTFSVTQEFQRPFSFNLWNDEAVILSVVGIADLFFVFLGLPRIGRR